MAGDLVFNAPTTFEVAAVNVYGNPAEVTQRLDQLAATLETLRLQGVKMSQEMDDLEAKVAAQETVQGSAITLLQTIKQELDAALAAGDTARIKALSNKIGTDTQALADAVTANTPAA